MMILIRIYSEYYYTHTQPSNCFSAIITFFFIPDIIILTLTNVLMIFFKNFNTVNVAVMAVFIAL